MFDGEIKGPAARPCLSCPYRRDVPSGVWEACEYEKLPPYDAPTGEQPPGVFLCHQMTGRLCAGWVGTHDMEGNLAIRFGEVRGLIDPIVVDAVMVYATDVPLFGSGAEAAEHGMRDVREPGDDALTAIGGLVEKTRLRSRRAQSPSRVSGRTAG